MDKNTIKGTSKGSNSNDIAYLIKTLRSLTKNTDMEKRRVINGMPEKILLASDVLNKLSEKLEVLNADDIEYFISELNRALSKIASAFPRKDKKWKKILSEVKNLINRDFNLAQSKLRNILKEEKEMIDALYEEVWLYIEEWEKVDEYLRNSGIKILPKDSKLVSICEKLVFVSNCNCWYIVNEKTKNRYEADKSKYSGERKREKILAHGSLGKIWISIICRGMQYGVTGTCQEKGTPGWFGFGLYFGDSNSTAYFFNNSNMKAYKSLNLVRIGRYDKWKYMEEKDGINSTQITKKYLNSKGYDSVMGTAPKLSGDEWRDEFCIYDEAQTTIYALVEMNRNDLAFILAQK